MLGRNRGGGAGYGSGLGDRVAPKLRPAWSEPGPAPDPPRARGKLRPGRPGGPANGRVGTDQAPPSPPHSPSPGTCGDSPSPPGGWCHSSGPPLTPFAARSQRRWDPCSRTPGLPAAHTMGRRPPTRPAHPGCPTRRSFPCSSVPSRPTPAPAGELCLGKPTLKCRLHVVQPVLEVTRRGSSVSAEWQGTPTPNAPGSPCQK